MNPLTTSASSTTTSEVKPQPAPKRDPRLASRDPRKARSQAQLAAADKSKATTATPSLQVSPNEDSVPASMPVGVNIRPTVASMIPQNVASVPGFGPHFQPQVPFMNAGMPQSGFPPVLSGTGSKPSSEASQVPILKATEPAKPTTKAQLGNKTLNKHGSPLKKANSQKLMQRKDGEKPQTTSIKENDKKKKDSIEKSPKSDGGDSKPKDRSKEHVKSRSRSPRDKYKNDKSKEVKPRHEHKSPKEIEHDRRPSSDYLRRRPRDDDHFSRKDRGKGTFRGHRGGHVRHGDFDRSKHRDGREVNTRSPRRSRSPGGDRHYKDNERSKMSETEKDSKSGKLEKELEMKDADIPMPPVPPIGILGSVKQVGPEKKDLNQPLPQIEMPLDVLLPKESEKQVRPSKRSSEHLDIDERSQSTPGTGPDDKRQRMEPLKLHVPTPSADLRYVHFSSSIKLRKSDLRFYLLIYKMFYFCFLYLFNA